MTQVYCVRHGQSHENAVDMVQRIQLEYFRDLLATSIDSPITELGREQAQRAAEYLAPHAITHLYASPFLRAQQTAAIIGQHLDLPIITVEQLHEVLPPVPPVLRRERQRTLRSLYLRGYLHQLVPRRAAEYETWWTARRRVANLWRDLSAEWRPSSHVVLVAHRGLLWLLLRYLDQRPGWQVTRRDLENGGVSEVVHV